MDVIGIRFVGVNAENGQKLLLTIALFLIIWVVREGLQAARSWLRRANDQPQSLFWSRQFINLFTTFLLVLGLLSIWFDDPTRLATGLGLVSAGLAFALRQVVTAIAGYFVILRGNTFTVGDRITMGGVRGDVIGLGFMQTTIMEMGQPPSVQGADPAMWVHSRQFTGRIVSVSNSQIFDEPVYNYSRDFPYIWEEITLPLPYKVDRDLAENILLNVAAKHTSPYLDQSRQAITRLKLKYFVQTTPVEPKVYYRLTDNWLELTVRFVSEAWGVRDLKDAMNRDILEEFDRAGIGLASATFEVVGLPQVTISGPLSDDAQ